MIDPSEYESLNELVDTTAVGCVDIAWDELPDEPLLRSLFFHQLSLTLEKLAEIEIEHQKRRNNERR